MWIVATKIEVCKESYIGHISKKKVFTKLDEAQKELEKVNSHGANYKLFRVSVQEVDGKDG